MSAQKSIGRHLALGSGAALVLVLGIGGWAFVTELAGAVIASGQLVVDSSVKKVQHPTGGVVGELRAKEGEYVKAGDVVVRLDETQTKANLGIVTKALDELAARQARNEAERDGSSTIQFPTELLARAEEPDVRQAIGGEQKLFNMRQSAREGQKAQLREQIAQLQQQIKGTTDQEIAKAKEVDWIRQELKGMRELWKQSLVPFNRITALERDAARLEGDRAMLVATMAQARGRIAETELKILQIGEDLRSEVGKELAEMRGKKAELSERRVSAADQLKRIDIVAPQDGRVFQRTVHTVGGVIQAGEAIMLIVPDGDALTIDAKVAPHEIDRVYVGQKALVRFSAFNQRTTPEVFGEVTRIGADVTQEEKRNETYYSLRIHIPDSELDRLEGAKPIAGMPVEVFLQAEPRTVLSYLVKPLQDQIAKAFRGR